MTGRRAVQVGGFLLLAVAVMVVAAAALSGAGSSRAPGGMQPTQNPSGPQAAATPPGAEAGSAPYLVMERDRLRSLSTEGEAWDALRAAADDDWPAADLDDRDTGALSSALAAALVHARTGEAGYRERVIEALDTLREDAPRDLLSVARQLGGWVVAADLVEYRDPAFVEWLHDIRYREIPGHDRWRTIYGTAGATANNYGTFALASLIAVDRFLGDERGMARDWQIFSGYGVPFAWPFEKTADWDVSYSCVETDPERPDVLPIAINPAGCDRWGGELDGMPVEDAAREGDFPDPHPGYVNEAMQGYAFQALLLSGAGYDAWAVNDEQVRRVAEYQQRWSIWNEHPTGYYVAWIVNDAYGTDYPVERPTASGRIFAWTDWLFP